MIKPSETTGVLLAGGKSARMGTDKGLLRIGEETFAGRILALLSAHFPEVLISTNNTKGYARFELPTVTDVFPKCGPLAGIHSALISARYPHIFVVPCDMPMIEFRVISRILEVGEPSSITIASCSHSLLPLLGVYPKLIQSEVEDFLKEGGRSVKGFLGAVSVGFEVLGLEELKECLLSITTPEDYEALLRLV